MAETTNAHTEAPSGEKVFPPFQPENFASQVLWLAVAFVALYLLMARLALPRVESIIEERRRHREGDLAEAQRLKQKSDEVAAAYEKELTEARARAQALANQMREKQAAQAEGLRRTLDADLKTRIAKAEAAIAETRTAAMTNVRGIAVDAAAAIIERLIGTVPANQDIVAAVGEALKR